jgi:hypothetical protein
LEQAALLRKSGAVEDRWHDVAERHRDDHAAVIVDEGIGGGDETALFAAERRYGRLDPSR